MSADFSAAEMSMPCFWMRVCEGRLSVSSVQNAMMCCREDTASVVQMPDSCSNCMRRITFMPPCPVRMSSSSSSRRRLKMNQRTSMGGSLRLAPVRWMDSRCRLAATSPRCVAYMRDTNAEVEKTDTACSMYLSTSRRISDLRLGAR